MTINCSYSELVSIAGKDQLVLSMFLCFSRWGASGEQLLDQRVGRLLHQQLQVVMQGIIVLLHEESLEKKGNILLTCTSKEEGITPTEQLSLAHSTAQKLQNISSMQNTSYSKVVNKPKWWHPSFKTKGKIFAGWGWSRRTNPHVQHQPFKHWGKATVLCTPSQCFWITYSFIAHSTSIVSHYKALAVTHGLVEGQLGAARMLQEMVKAQNRTKIILDFVLFEVFYKHVHRAPCSVSRVRSECLVFGYTQNKGHTQRGTNHESEMTTVSLVHGHGEMLNRASRESTLLIKQVNQTWAAGFIQL